MCWCYVNRLQRKEWVELSFSSHYFGPLILQISCRGLLLPSIRLRIVDFHWSAWSATNLSLFSRVILLLFFKEHSNGVNWANIYIKDSTYNVNDELVGGSFEVAEFSLLLSLSLSVSSQQQVDSIAYPIFKMECSEYSALFHKSFVQIEIVDLISLCTFTSMAEEKFLLLRQELYMDTGIRIESLSLIK